MGALLQARRKKIALKGGTRECEERVSLPKIDDIPVGKFGGPLPRCQSLWITHDEMNKALYCCRAHFYILRPILANIMIMFVRSFFLLFCIFGGTVMSITRPSNECRSSSATLGGLAVQDPHPNRSSTTCP